MRVLVLGLIAFGIAGCSGEPAAQKPPLPPKNPNWEYVGKVNWPDKPNDKRFQFVMIRKEGAKQMETYRNAIAHLCSTPVGFNDAFPDSNGCFQIGFYLEGQKMPKGFQIDTWNAIRGWAAYEEIALYDASSDRFMVWDCKRAGKEEAPAGAACD